MTKVKCESDAVVVLTSGVVIDLDATLDAPSDHLLAAAWDVHGPSGTTLGGYWAGDSGAVDAVSYTADLAASTYSATVTFMLREVTVNAAMTAALRAGGKAAGATGTVDAGADSGSVTVNLGP